MENQDMAKSYRSQETILAKAGQRISESTGARSEREKILTPRDVSFTNPAFFDCIFDHSFRVLPQNRGTILHGAVSQINRGCGTRPWSWTEQG